MLTDVTKVERLRQVLLPARGEGRGSGVRDGCRRKPTIFSTLLLHCTIVVEPNLSHF
ncbi:hypothetical protein PYH37_004826 [Sinorhizobium numidicum]|uniref:Transposase n=1 Tax=Sinorhizobium numidicum TaxID=680248 RepID=A0ABY8CX05_9HYPH|nr:hypothetical protein [Sinorhizobium numidicum]WEX76515.1 hypothetical protein PYH37_004826 [Sinorhizobium numidicum]WEX83176.1 hypothetical protein PYH38_005538 [Sinorhizobium numidicum]